MSRNPFEQGNQFWHNGGSKKEKPFDTCRNPFEQGNQFWQIEAESAYDAKEYVAILSSKVINSDVWIWINKWI